MTGPRSALAAALLLLAATAWAQETPARLSPGTAPAAPVPAVAVITAGSKVQIEYTLKDDAGAVLDSNQGRDPLRYVHGEHQIIAGLERALTGLSAGDEKHVTLGPEEAFGPVVPDAQTEVPKEMLPAGALVVGTRLLAKNANGDSRPVLVKEIRDRTVLLDLNHPLAGKTLVFEVKVLGVEPPTAAPPAATPTPGAPAPVTKPGT